MLILAIVVVVSVPVGHATNNVHTFYLGNSVVGACSGKCENLLTSTGAADTTTTQHLGKTTLGTYQIEPDMPGTTTTGTPFTSSVSGYSWVYSTDLGGSTIQSGTWTFDLTTNVNTIGGNPVGNLWITVWNCTTNSLGSCNFLFKNWDNTTNVLASTSATPHTYNTGTIGPFSNIHFISVEYWISYTTLGSQSNLAVTETTVSSASDVITPGWNYVQNPSGSLTLASNFAKQTSIFKALSSALTQTSAFAEKISLFRSLSASLAMVSGLGEKISFFRTLADSITFAMGNMVANVNSGGLTCNSNPRSCSTTLTTAWTMTSGFAEKSSRLRSLSGSLGLASSEIKGLARSLTGSLSLGSGFVEKGSLFRSLTGSLSLASGFVEKGSLFRSLSGSLGLASSQVKGLARSLSGSLSASSGFVEKSSIFRSLSSSLSLASSQVKGLAKSLSVSLSLSGSLSASSGFVVKSSLFRSLSGSLSLASFHVALLV